MHQHLNHQALSILRPANEHELRKFLVRLLQRPDEFIGHIHKLVAGFIVLSTYGHEVISDDDPYVERVERAMYMTGNSGSTGLNLIDVLPPC